MEEQATCGKGLAAHAALPRLMGLLTDAVGEVLDLHREALDLSDWMSRVEHAAYTDLATRHRSLATELRSLSQHMAEHHDLPMGRHDEQKLGEPKQVQAFERLVSIEADLTFLLQARLEEHREMLRAIGSDPIR